MVVRRKALLSVARLATLQCLHVLSDILFFTRGHDKCVIGCIFDKVQNVPQLVV
jgi:hypothetical protein